MTLFSETFILNDPAPSSSKPKLLATYQRVRMLPGMTPDIGVLAEGWKVHKSCLHLENEQTFVFELTQISDPRSTNYRYVLKTFIRNGYFVQPFQRTTVCVRSYHCSLLLNWVLLMAHSHWTGPGPGQGPGNDGFLYYAMYCTHYTGTKTCNHCFLLYLS